MRKLNTLDLMKCVSIGGRIAKKVKDSINIEEGKELNSTQLGISFFAHAMEHAENDLIDLLSSIAEMDRKEFEQMPLGYSLDLIEEIAEKEDLQGFLQRVITLVKKLFQK